MAKHVQKQLSLVSFMTTGECSTDDKQGGQQCPSDTSEMQDEPGCETQSHEASLSDTVSQPELAEGCDAHCCNSTRDKPDQPMSRDILANTKRVQGPQARYVQPSWFKQHTWLTLYTTRQKLFCFPCVTAVHRNLLVFSKNADSGFNWRKAEESFRKHETSYAHSEALLKPKQQGERCFTAR